MLKGFLRGPARAPRARRRRLARSSRISPSISACARATSCSRRSKRAGLTVVGSHRRAAEASQGVRCNRPAASRAQGGGDVALAAQGIEARWRPGKETCARQACPCVGGLSTRPAACALHRETRPTRQGDRHALHRTRSLRRLRRSSPPFAQAQELPGRVGRLAFIEGQVSLYHDPDEGWERARINYPLTSENSLWTDRGSRAEMRVSGISVRLAETTQLDLVRVDDNRLETFVAQGSINVRVRHLDTDQRLDFSTPHARFRLIGVGRYRIDVDAQSDESTLTVFAGSATLRGSRGSNVQVRPGSALRIYGGSQSSYNFERASVTAFDRWSNTRDERWSESRSVRYVSTYMTGYEDLDAHGEWARGARAGRPLVSRRVSSVTGLRIVTAVGRTSAPGAGPGSTTHRGDTRRSTMAVGSMSATAGPGSPGPTREPPGVGPGPGLLGGRHRERKRRGEPHAHGGLVSTVALGSLSAVVQREPDLRESRERRRAQRAAEAGSPGVA